MERLGLKPGYVVVTVHRAENVDDSRRLSKITYLIEELAARENIVFPVHPRTKRRLSETGLLDRLTKRVVLTEPLGYLDFVKLLIHCSAIVTDSGGVQREAYLLRPAIVLGKTTEWVELVECGWVKLLDPDEEVSRGVSGWRHSAYVEGLLGDGRAPERIAQIIAEEILLWNA